MDHGATTIVLSQGMLKRVEICPETLGLLKQQGVGVHVLPTQDAVDLYNELCKTEQVSRDCSIRPVSGIARAAFPTWI